MRRTANWNKSGKEVLYQIFGSFRLRIIFKRKDAKTQRALKKLSVSLRLCVILYIMCPLII